MLKVKDIDWDEDDLDKDGKVITYRLFGEVEVRGEAHLPIEATKLLLGYNESMPEGDTMFLTVVGQKELIIKINRQGRMKVISVHPWNKPIGPEVNILFLHGSPGQETT
jgi:hypothetical protein